MTPSAACLAIIRRFEGLELEAYLCPAGIPTIGYGHTKGVKMGDRCTLAQAEAWLVEDAEDAARSVRKLVQVALTQGMFDALVSFVFNLGSGRLRDSTMLKLLNKGDYTKAAGQFALWVHSNGKRLAGLVQRRAAEADLFLKPMEFHRA